MERKRVTIFYKAEGSLFKNPKQRFGIIHENIKKRLEIIKLKFWILSFRLAKKDFAWKAWNGAGAGVGAGARTGAGAWADSSPANDFIFYDINLTNN